jgi:hypothetical protein
VNLASSRLSGSSSVRRDYFQNVQGGRASNAVLDDSSLPAKTDAVQGIAWLPRLMPKALAKLRGELPPSLMYCCGGDRRFFKGTQHSPGGISLPRLARRRQRRGHRRLGQTAFGPMRPPRRYRHLIWDWNGTLLDDLDYSIGVMNGVARAPRPAAARPRPLPHAFDFPVRNYYARLGFDTARDSFEQLSVEFISRIRRAAARV